MPSDGVDTVGHPRILDRIPTWVFAALIAAAVAVVSDPNLHGFWGRDDFAQLALVRMIGAPWPLFVHDHFFIAGSVFRPLGFFSLWLCEKLFGTDYAPNAAFDIALHAAVALTLFRVLLRSSIPPLVAALATLLFAVHPVVIGPSLWLSARFDLQSTLFILLAISAGIRYRERMTMLSLACALLASLAAMLSKENGVVSVAALTLIWGRWIFIAPGQRKRAVVAIASAWLIGVVFFVWRGLVLGTFSSRVTGPVPLAEAILEGLLNWARDAAAYFSFAPRLNALQTGLIGVGLLVVMTAFVVVRFTHKLQRDRLNVDALRIGFLLFVLPAITQAPIAAFASPLSADMSAIEAGMQSRLYYLQTAGLMLMLASAIGPLYRTADRGPRIAILASMALIAATFAWVSHDSAREFAQRSFTIAAPARAAVDAIEPLDLPGDHCHIAFLGYQPPPEWNVFVSMDSIVKALSVTKAVRHCWIHSDAPTYLYILPGTVDANDALPFTPAGSGQLGSWRRLGNLQFAYLNAPDEKTVIGSGMRFLVLKDGRFVDASADVRAGAIPARLK